MRRSAFGRGGGSKHAAPPECDDPNGAGVVLGAAPRPALVERPGAGRVDGGPSPTPPHVRSVPDLTSKQRAHLRGLAHALKPLAHIGKEGVTDAAVDALRQTFETHEVVKVRVLEAAPEDARTTAQALADRIDGAAVVQTVGRNATLYRPDPDAPTVRLPAR